MKQIRGEGNHYLSKYFAVRRIFLGSAIALGIVKQIPSSSRGKNFKKTLGWALGLIMILAFGAAIIWLRSEFYATFFPVFPANQKTAQPQEIKGNFDLELEQIKLENQLQNSLQNQETSSKEAYLPPKDEDLPEGNWFVIPKIGVNSLLQDTENYRQALDTGLWLVPDFGEPGDQEIPMIVAGHRFGFEWWWQDDYWKYHSFYLLPELEPGDRIEVISDQRKWIYEIYEGEEGPEVTDYQADLIVYTCKDLDSPVRIFRYAKLLVGE